MPKAPRSPLALVVLALLDEAPMHPYRIQRLIVDRGMGEVVNVRQRASLYQTIERLHRDGLIAVARTVRQARRPDRTVYRLTPAGRAAVRGWLRTGLGHRAEEFPTFPAAVSFVYLLEPAEAREELERRLHTLDAERDRLRGVLAEHGDTVPRLFLLELEYLERQVAAEREWVAGVIADLETGRLTWSRAWIAAVAKAAANQADQADPPAGRRRQP